MTKNTHNPLKPPSLGWIETLSHILDSQFRLPGTNFKFGLDPILGMIPVAGDVATFLVSALLFINMAKYGASRKVVILMALNIIFDFIIGSIPLIGWIFDFGFRANDRNIKLLKQHYYEGKHQGSGTGIILMILLVMLLVFGIVVYGMYKLFAFLFHLMGNLW